MHHGPSRSPRSIGTPMATSPAAAAVTLGGKGATLSPAAVHLLALGRTGPVLVDPSALRALSSSTQDQTPAPARQISDDSRAAAAVLLHKLLLTEADSPSASGLVVTAAMAHALAAGSLDVGALTHDEAAVARRRRRRPSPAASAKDEADVAADLRKLLTGSSNLAAGAGGGASAAAAFAKVPAVHGPFRAAARALHANVLAELNAPVRLGKWDTGEGKEEEEASMLLAGQTGEVEEEALMGLATSLVWSAHAMCKLNVARTRLCARTIADAELREKLVAAGTNADDLKVMLDRVRIDSDAVSVLWGVYDYLLKLREVLAWEAAVAMAVI